MRPSRAPVSPIASAKRARAPGRWAIRTRRVVSMLYLRMASRYVILDMGAKASGIEAKLRELALSYPDTYEEFPWGDRALKVKPNKKVFVFMGPASMSVKLPHSAADVLDMPYAEPTHYGLGKSGWVTIMYAGAA